MKKFAINIKELSFSFGQNIVLSKVNAEISPNCMNMIMGRNGSGKSTLLKLIAGLYPIKEGEIEVLGHNVTGLSFRDRAKLSGYLPQMHRPVFPFSVYDVVLTGRAGYSPIQPSRKDKEAALDAIQKTGIKHLSDRPFTDLSGGEQQLARIARVIAQDPAILLLDEPASHLDLHHQVELMKTLRRLSESGYTVVVVMHDPNLAFMFGDEFYFLDKHQIVRHCNKNNLPDRTFLSELYQTPLLDFATSAGTLIIPDLQNLNKIPEK